MADGTIVKIYAKRIHKHNAHDVLANAKDMKRWYENKLIAMAAHSPSPQEQNEETGYWYEHAAMEVPNLLQEYAGECFKELVAQNLIDFPDDCEDELEGFDNG
jgi:hypothetical protein